MSKAVVFCLWLYFPIFVFAFAKVPEESDPVDQLVTAAIIAAMFDGALFCVISAIEVLK